MLFTDDEWPGGKNLAVSPAIWRRMFEDIPSKSFGLNYDPSHMVWQQMDYLAPMREFADRLFHVHAKDVRVDRHRLDQVGILATPLEYHSPKLPGLGEVDWGRFFSVLGDTGYRVRFASRSRIGPTRIRSSRGKRRWCRVVGFCGSTYRSADAKSQVTNDKVQTHLKSQDSIDKWTTPTKTSPR